jgi:hypothetical protein
VIATSVFDFLDGVFYSYHQSILPRVGAVAQLGERLNGIQEVVGSTPIGSTNILNGLWVTDPQAASQL